MNKNRETQLSDKLAKLAILGMQEKKGNDIMRLDMRSVNATLSDYFVICNADSAMQVNAIAKSVEEEVYKALGQEPWHKEGHANGEWLLLDFVDVVIHIFKTDARNRYRIEDLWGDAQVEKYQSA